MPVTLRPSKLELFVPIASCSPPLAWLSSLIEENVACGHNTHRNADRQATFLACYIAQESLLLKLPSDFLAGQWSLVTGKVSGWCCSMQLLDRAAGAGGQHGRLWHS
jgi:hypothetical protein